MHAYLTPLSPLRAEKLEVEPEAEGDVGDSHLQLVVNQLGAADANVLAIVGQIQGALWSEMRWGRENRNALISQQHYKAMSTAVAEEF